MKLSIVVPFHNEERSVAPLLREYLGHRTQYEFELICVNDASRDGTAEAFRQLQKDPKYSFVRYISISSDEHIGYGHAIMTGVHAAQGEVIAWTHSDMQADPGDVFRAYDLYLREGDERTVVKGRRAGRRFGQAAFSFGMAVISSVILRKIFFEINAQPKLFHRSALPILAGAPGDFSLDLYLLYQAKKSGYAILDIDVFFRPRMHGVSSWASTFSLRIKTIKRTMKYISKLGRAPVVDKKDIKRVWDLVRSFEGFLSRHEGEFLYGAARACVGKGVIVEIGSFKGRSTSWIGSGSRAGNKVPVYAIDPHISPVEHKGVSSFETFKKNIGHAGVSDLIHPIVKKSQDAVTSWSKPIEFLWIDGDHSYEGARIDYDLWAPFVVEGGVVAFHDSTGDAVQRVVKETIFSGAGYRNPGIVDSISYAQKTSLPTPLSQKFKARYVSGLSSLHNVRHAIPTPLRKVLKEPMKRIVRFLH
jgi:glycosyltransferase involved in cell wall biosynthesis